MEPTSEIHVSFKNSSLFIPKSLDTCKEDAYAFASRVFLIVDPRKHWYSLGKNEIGGAKAPTWLNSIGNCKDTCSSLLLT